MPSQSTDRWHLVKDERTEGAGPPPLSSGLPIHAVGCSKVPLDRDSGTAYVSDRGGRLPEAGDRGGSATTPIALTPGQRRAHAIRPGPTHTWYIHAGPSGICLPPLPRTANPGLKF